MAEIKRTALVTLASGVVIGTLLSVVAILFGTWSWFEVRIILSTYTISGASIVALAAAARSVSDERYRPLSVAGVILSVLGASLVLIGLWTDFGDITYARITLTVVLFATAIGHVCLLSFARLAPRFRWAMLLAGVSIFGMATVIVAIAWGVASGDGAFRLLGILAVGAGAASVLIPIFHVLSRESVRESPVVRQWRPTNPDVSRAVSVKCPCCGYLDMRRLGRITCRECNSVFDLWVVSVSASSGS